jgi:hypothetical protein
MSEPARLVQRRLALERGLIELSEAREQLGELRSYMDPRIVGQQLRVGSSIRRIVQSKALLQVWSTTGEFPEYQERVPDKKGAYHLRRNVAGSIAQLSQFRSEPLRLLQIAASPMIAVLRPHGGEQRTRPIQRQRELARPWVHVDQFRRAPAPARGECLTEGDPQVELGFPMLICIGERMNERQPAAEQRDGFGNRRARPGLPAGGEPIFDRPLGQPRLREVLAEQRRLGRDNLRETVFEGGRDQGVQLLPAAAQQP